MRLAAVALASMLLSCAPGGDNAMNAGDNVAGSGMPAQGQAQPPSGAAGAAPGAQPVNGQPAPEPSGEISLRASPQQVNAGATMTLTLDNGTSQQLGYNLCTSALQTADGSEVRTDRVCTMELRTLEPGRSASYPYDLPANLEDGAYRFAANVERMENGAPTTVTSNNFQVR